jgi:thiopeptide-type bacteriocin biosynthesis protein
VRYRDPAPHLRLRLQGDRDRLSAEAVPALHAVLEPLLASGAVRQWSLDTYRPERRRYGGADGLSAAEAIFAADSAAVARLVALLSDGAPVDTRWLLGLCGVDRLLGGFGFDTAARLAVTAPLQDAFAREFGGGRALRSALGALHRSKRHLVDAALADDDDACAALLAHEDTRLAGLLAAGRRVLDERGDAIADAVCELRRLDETRVLERPLPAVAASLVHMHLNRMLAEQQRAQERVIYELLCRSYTSRLARGRGRVADGDPALESESGAGG